MRQHMSRAQRAKQFMPFSALKGYEEAVRASERRPESRRLLGEDAQEELDRALRCIRPGDRVRILYYREGEYRELRGRVHKTDPLSRCLLVESCRIPTEDIYEAEKI